MERLAAGTSLHDLPALLPGGLLAQAAVAIVGAWLLRAAIRTGDRLRTLAGAPALTAVSDPLRVVTTLAAVPRRAPLFAPVGRRAPPIGR